jgi:site-specific recombinase XerD
MAITGSIIAYRRFLKRRNCSVHTVKNYMHTLRQFVLWVDVPIEQVTCKKIQAYIDYLRARRLRPKTVNCHLDSIRAFYNYLIDEEDIRIENPVKRGYNLRMAKPLPRYLKDEQVVQLFAQITNCRDRAIFMLMLRCGLRVEEVANLTTAAVDLRRAQLFVHDGKGGKDRIVYLSSDAQQALSGYLNKRSSLRVKKVFLVEKGDYKGRPLSVRGIQKRMEYYANKASLVVCCHQLRHTMATQLLNADADLVVIQDLLGHSQVRTTQRYCKVSNLKVQRDYHKAIGTVMQRHGP